MSFPRAKIHRFNEKIPCAPPPGTYNPATIDKSVGPVINKCERFADGKDIFVTTSCESLNTLEDDKKTPFKTPKVPASASKFEMKRSSFSHRKACSTEFICKKNDRSFEMNSLKNSLNEVQEELTLERHKTNNLLNEIEKLKTEQTDICPDVWVTVLNEKLDTIALLKERCSLFEDISFESFQSYQKHVMEMYSIFETHFKNTESSEIEFQKIFDQYEQLISKYEIYLEQISKFLSELIFNQRISMDLSKSHSSQEAILGLLRESEKEKRKYELVVHEMQKVINVLSDRVLESDREVEKLHNILASKDEENEKSLTNLREKDSEIEALKTFMNNVTSNFLNEVQTKEKDLLKLVDLIKEKAFMERKIYEKKLQEKNSAIFKLQTEKSRTELQLQESLDQIETLKCKEETCEKILEQIRNENSEIKSLLEDYQQQRNFYDEKYLSNNELNVTFTKEMPENFAIPEEAETFVQHLFQLTTQQVDTGCDKTNNLFEIVQNENLSELKSVEISKENLENPIWLQNMLNLVYNTFCKFNTENVSLKTNYTRLRNDFVEKCDECAQLTQLLQVSEKRVEFYENQNSQLEISKTELEKQMTDQKTKIDKLENEKFSAEERINELIFEIKNNEVMIATVGEELASLRQQPNSDKDQKFIELENSLKEVQTKLKTVEKENSRLNKLVGPYRQTLEKFNVESKFLSSKEDCTKKFAKLLEQQNTRQKLKEITKLRTDIVQLRKKNDELQTEINKYKKVAAKPGKENKSSKKISAEKLAQAAGNPVNFTYVITSPKVNRI